MYKIAICDDEKVLVNELEKFVLAEAERRGICIDTEVFWDGRSLVDYVEASNDVDLIFMDIEMPLEDGIKAAQRIRLFDPLVLIIYISGHSEYMQDTFEVRPFRFLIKPLNSDKLLSYFEAALYELGNSDYYYQYNFRRKQIRIFLRDILYFESEKRKIKIIRAQKCDKSCSHIKCINYWDTYKEPEYMYQKMNILEKDLKKGKVPFLRIHQSYLVNYLHIAEVAYDHIVLNTKEMLPISEDKRKQISSTICMIGDRLHDKW